MASQTFQQATRQNQRFNAPATIPAAGGAVTFQLQPVGLLASMTLEIAGTMTIAHASLTAITQALLSPWSMIERVRVVANNGLNIVDISGYGLYLENLTHVQGAIFDQGSTLDDVYHFPAVASSGGTSNTFNFGLKIPIALNDRDLLGIFLLQNPETIVTVRVDFKAPTADGALFTTLSGFTLSSPSFTATLTTEYFSVPADPQAFPPIDAILQTIEAKQTYAATGTNDFVVQRGNILTKYINYYTFNGAMNAGNLDLIELVYNQTETPYSRRPTEIRREMRDMYGRIFPAGVYVQDLNNQGVPQLGTARDWINTAAISDLRVKTHVTAGTPVDHYLVTQQVLMLDKR